MVAAITGGWIAFGITAACILLFSFFFTKLYTDRHDSEAFPTTVTVIGLSVVLCIVCLVPVDIFLVASTMDTITGLRQDWATPEAISDLLFALDLVYYIAYSLIALFVFVMIPFAYFYFEEYDEGVTTKQRVFGALKYTIFTTLVMVILYVLGLLLQPGESDPTNPEWYKSLLTANGAVRAVTFVIAVMTIIGLIVFICYSAYGLFAMPVDMIKKRNIGQEQLEVSNDLESTRSQKSMLESKYLGGKKMSSKDKKAINELDRKERLLSRRSNLLDQESKSFYSRCVACMRPFRVVLGILFLLVSLLIFTSLLLTTIDKAANSFCGVGCGFILENPQIFNPMDSLFVVLSRAFPVDYILLVLLIFYFFAVSLAGIVKIGIRFLWIKLYSIRPRATVPQALLMLCGLLMFALLALTMYIISLAPDYTSFGYQKYCNATIVPGEESPCVADPELLVNCSLDAPADTCTPSAISTIFNRIQAMQPFFGVVYFVSNWLFLVAAIIGFFVAVCKKKTHAIRLPDSDDEE